MGHPIFAMSGGPFAIMEQAVHHHYNVGFQSQKRAMGITAQAPWLVPSPEWDPQSVIQGVKRSKRGIQGSAGHDAGGL